MFKKLWSNRQLSTTARTPHSKKTKILLGILAGMIVMIGGVRLYRSGLFRRTQPKIHTQKVIPPSSSAQDLSALLSQAEMLYDQGRTDESLKIYQDALKTNPNNARLHNDLGLILLNQDRLKDSEEHLIIAVELDPACSECHNNLGILQTRQNKSREAEKHFKEAIVLNEKYTEPYYNLGVLYEKNGDRGNAIISYEDFLKHSEEKKSLVYLQVQNRVLILRSKQDG